MSSVMRKPAFCICENKGEDQLRGNRTADQCLCFRPTGSTILLPPKFKISSLYLMLLSVLFVSDLVGNPEVRFSYDEAHMSKNLKEYNGACTLRPVWPVQENSVKTAPLDKSFLSTSGKLLCDALGYLENIFQYI